MLPIQDKCLTYSQGFHGDIAAMDWIAEGGRKKLLLTTALKKIPTRSIGAAARI